MRKFINFRMNKRGAGRRAWWGAGRGAGVARGAGRGAGVARAWRGARLGARNPASPYISVSFAPSPTRFFAPSPRRLGARNPAGPYISVPFAPSPTRFFARGRRRLGARNPASPYISVPFAPSPPHFFTRGRAGVVPHRSLSLAIPCSFVLRHHVSEHRRKVMHQDFRLRASLFPYYIFKGKELTTNTTRPPFVVNSNHLPVPLAPTCIRHHKKLTTDSRIRKVCRQSNFFFMFLL